MKFYSFFNAVIIVSFNLYFLKTWLNIFNEYLQNCIIHTQQYKKLYNSFSLLLLQLLHKKI
jgi:hypothetical protein